MTQENFRKWPSIELFHNLYRDFEKLGISPKLRYQAKIKLDGTNAGVRVLSDGTVIAQSRTRIITPDDDNYGFARWVEANSEYFASLEPGSDFTIFGEWCGQGIQKRTAIAQLDRKIFAVFAVQFDDEFEHYPDRISQLVTPHPDIHILPFDGEKILIDFSDKTGLELVLQGVNDRVLAAEAVDPWVEKTFGLSGMGEGLVFYPSAGSDDLAGLRLDCLLFKAKGEKHQVVKVKKPAQIDPGTAASVQEFVEMFVAENRLQQSLSEACGGMASPEKTSVFLQWLTSDVQKESVAELEASSLSWNDVKKSVATTAREWYLAKSRSL